MPTSDAPPSPLHSTQIQPWLAGQAQARQRDRVITEMPVALVFNGLCHVVLMATPMELEALAMGFSLSEGVLPDASHYLGAEVVSHAAGLELQVRITNRSFEALLARHHEQEGPAGDGLNGIEALEALQQYAPVPRPPVRPDWRQDATPIVNAAQAAMERMPDWQMLNGASGGCHAAGWADLEGQLHLVHEDIGRHNALDKLIGDLARRGWLDRPGVVVVSGGAGVEMVRKCARVGLGALATLSAPTSLAVSTAQAHGLHLLGLNRAPCVIQYTHLDGAPPVTARS